MMKLICFIGAVGGFLLAIHGMFSFSLGRIFTGLALYVVSGYVWEVMNSKQ